MQFYPHKTSVNKAATAVSASIALTGSLINNFSAIAINRVLTASVALNITGSRGTDGTSVAVIGPTGPIGPRGETGYRGGNIFLLSSSWTSSLSTCGGVTSCFGSYILRPAGPGTECNVTRGRLYNTNYGNLISITDTSANGSILFTDTGCSTVAANVGVHNGSVIFYTNGAGVISTEICTQPPEPPAPVCNGPFAMWDTGSSAGNCETTTNEVDYYVNYDGAIAEANGYTLYTTDACDTTANNITKHRDGKVFVTNGSGVISISDCTS